MDHIELDNIVATLSTLIDYFIFFLSKVCQPGHLYAKYVDSGVKIWLHKVDLERRIISPKIWLILKKKEAYWDNNEKTNKIVEMTVKGYVLNTL